MLGTIQPVSEIGAIAQECGIPFLVFIKIYKNIGSLKNDKKIQAWIYSITRNTITDYYRKNHNSFETTELPEEPVISTDEDFSANTEIASCLKVMVDRRHYQSDNASFAFIPFQLC